MQRLALYASYRDIRQVQHLAGYRAKHDARYRPQTARPHDDVIATKFLGQSDQGFRRVTEFDVRLAGNSCLVQGVQNRLHGKMRLDFQMFVDCLLFHAMGLPLERPGLDIGDMNLDGAMFSDEVDKIRRGLKGGI